MAGIVLQVERREKTGTSGAREVRNREQVPGVLYGGARGPVPIEVNKKALVKALKSGKFLSHMITLEHGGEQQPVIPREVQFHPVSDDPIHIDLYRVEETSIIEVDVTVHFKNHADCPGLKRGGALNVVEHAIKLRVPAGKIPEELVVDLAGLDIGAVIHESSVVLPAGAALAAKDKDATVATITGRMAEAAAAEGEAAPAS
jgi:large subunit ribosomal protein L25